jgi:putative ABC transport system substrate-binding protein
MRRRELALGIGGLMAFPLTGWALAQKARTVIAFLSSGSAAGWAPVLPAFLAGLREAGYTEGENVTVEYVWAAGNYDRLPSMAADLARRPIAPFVAAGGAVTALAAKAATSSIPIIMVIGDDPVRFGLVESLGRPGGNVTGVTLFVDVLTPKRLEILSEFAPSASLVMLSNPQNPNADSEATSAHEAARRSGRDLRILKARTVFAELSGTGPVALMIGTDPFFYAVTGRLAELAARHAIPALSFHRQFALSGGLISYGATLTEEHRMAGLYAGRILNGEKPADLPVLQPIRFELVINLQSAKTLGLTIPPTLLARADEVIE